MYTLTTGLRTTSPPPWLGNWGKPPCPSLGHFLLRGTRLLRRFIDNAGLFAGRISIPHSPKAWGKWERQRETERETYTLTLSSLSLWI